MKKLFISIIALVSAMTMTAQTTADVTLRLKSQSGSVSEMYLFAGPDLAANPERGSLMVNASNPEDINIYAVDPANGNRYSSFGNETLVNIPVGIITSKEAASLQNYTIHFEVLENAEVLKLMDLVTGTETEITNGGSYAFTIAAATDPSYVEGTYSTIADRFVINIQVEPSLCFNYNVLEINGHKGESLVVKKGETEIVNVDALPLLYSKDLSDQSGRLVVTLNGQDYQIDANPAVTPVP